MKVYIITATQHIPDCGLGMGDVEMVCSSLKKANEQMDALIRLNEENNLFPLHPEYVYQHKLVSDYTYPIDFFQKTLREIVFEHWVYGAKSSTTYYRLIVKEVNDGLIIL